VIGLFFLINPFTRLDAGWLAFQQKFYRNEEAQAGTTPDGPQARPVLKG
jgi:hypothetical protein